MLVVTVAGTGRKPHMLKPLSSGNNVLACSHFSGEIVQRCLVGERVCLAAGVEPQTDRFAEQCLATVAEGLQPSILV